MTEDLGPQEKGNTNGTYLNEKWVPLVPVGGTCLNEKKITTEIPVFSGDIFLSGTIWLRFEK